MVSYIVWSLLPIPRVRNRVKAWLANRQQSQQLENLIQNGTSATTEANDDVDWERAQQVNRYSPTIQTPGEGRDTAPTKGSTAADGTATHTGDDSGLSSEGKPSYGSIVGSTNVSFHTCVSEEDK